MLLPADLDHPLDHMAGSIFTQSTYEAPEIQTLRVRDLILEYASHPDDLILSTPYYAYLADRRLVAECSSSLMWSLRYKNAKRSGRPDPTLDAFLKRMIDELGSGRVGIVLLRERQYGQMPEIRQAVEENFDRLILDLPIHAPRFHRSKSRAPPPGLLEPR